MLDNIKYVYGFAATKTAVVKEYLYHSSKGQKAMVFSRSGQGFESREGLTTADQLPADLPEGNIAALKQFAKALSDDPNVSERKLQIVEVNVTSFHRGLDKEGRGHLYGLPLSVESDGTRQLMALAPAIEYMLSCGGVLLVDELENRIHPLLMQLIVSKFQNPKSNLNHAQLIFTIHNTELLDAGLIRKDQVYFVDKDKTSGSSSLYSISEFSITTNENIRKGYLLGKYGAAPELDADVPGIIQSLVGAIPHTGMTLSELRDERLGKFEAAN